MTASSKDTVATDRYADGSRDTAEIQTPNLARRSLIGARQLGLSRLVADGLLVGSTTLLARVLSPHQYGLVGLVTVAVGLLLLVNDFGLGIALVRERELTADVLRGVFWINLAIGFAFAALCVGVSGVVA